jgi:hypothetical protein
MRCPSLAAQTTLRHDILKGILRRVVHRAGIASALEPPLRRLPGLADSAGIAADGSPLRPGARSDILIALPRGSLMTEDVLLQGVQPCVAGRIRSWGHRL